LDNDERGKGALTLQTLAALYHKVPLLVSTSLLKNIFVGIATRHVTAEEALKDSTGESIFLFYVATVRTSFQDKEWLILKIGDNLVLLLPMHVVQKLGGSPEARGLVFTQQEFNLGLKISSFEKFTREGFLAFLEKYTPPRQLNYFLDGITSLLITHDEYVKNNALSQQPQWTFFLNGHGLVKGNIAGLSEETFLNFLQYLNTQLLTRFLVVSSCFAMSVIKQNREKMLSTYLFPIAVIGSVDCAAFVPHPILHVEGSAKTSRWQFAENLTQSFEYVWEKKYDSSPYDASLILASEAILLQADAGGQQDASYFAAYVPYVLAAGSTTFVPLLPAVEINKQMTLSRGADSPLDILTTIDEQEKQQRYTAQLKYVLLLLNTEPDDRLNIKFPIILRKEYQEQPAPYIMVASRDKNYFYIARIESDWPLSDIINSIGYLHYGVRKIYWIANFVDKSGKESKIYGSPVDGTYTNMIIDVDGQGGVDIYAPSSSGQSTDVESNYEHYTRGTGFHYIDLSHISRVLKNYRAMFSFALDSQ